MVRVLSARLQDRPSQRFLLDIPAEIRVMIYRHNFDHPDVTDNVLQIEYAPASDQFSLMNERNEALNDIFDTMIALKTLNKEVCKEPRSVLWSLASFTVAPRYA